VRGQGNLKNAPYTLTLHNASYLYKHFLQLNLIGRPFSLHNCQLWNLLPDTSWEMSQSTYTVIVMFTCWAYLVLHEIIVHLKTNGHWSMFHQLHPHEWFIARPVEPSHIVVVTCVLSFTRGFHTWRIFGSVFKTFFLHYAKVLSIFSCWHL